MGWMTDRYWLSSQQDWGFSPSLRCL